MCLNPLTFQAMMSIGSNTSFANSVSSNSGLSTARVCLNCYLVRSQLAWSASPVFVPRLWWKLLSLVGPKPVHYLQKVPVLGPIHARFDPMVLPARKIGFPAWKLEQPPLKLSNDKKSLLLQFWVHLEQTSVCLHASSPLEPKFSNRFLIGSLTKGTSFFQS